MNFYLSQIKNPSVVRIALTTSKSEPSFVGMNYILCDDSTCTWNLWINRFSFRSLSGFIIVSNRTVQRHHPWWLKQRQLLKYVLFQLTLIRCKTVRCQFSQRHHAKFDHIWRIPVRTKSSGTFDRLNTNAGFLYEWHGQYGQEEWWRHLLSTTPLLFRNAVRPFFGPTGQCLHLGNSQS